jgi:hypothetical protein
MYYQAHADGRGAEPTSYDSNVLNQVHPIANTPPYSFDRIIDSITATPAPSVPGVNEVIAAHDLQGLPVTAALAESTSLNGTFSVTSNLVVYAPPGSGNAARIEPPTLTAYDWTYTRGSDGVHWSPYARVQVLSFSSDTYPAGASDGIPNNWMTKYFGSSSGASAGGDADIDTLTNFEEYRTWMNPTNSASAQLLSAADDGTVSWQGKAYELYELHGSTNLTDWFFVKAVLPTNDTPSVKVDPTTHASAVYRAFKVK